MNNIVSISQFKNCFNPLPIKHIPLYDFYNSIINGDYASEVERIRSNPEAAKELKKKLPCVTVSGIFRHRDEKNLILHSGRICIDIDGKDNTHIEDWYLVRTTLGGWGSIEFAALSASAKGVFVVIPIRYPERHKDHYTALETIFAKYGLKIDSQCKDVCRLRFMTYDKDAVFNKDVTQFRLTYPEPRPKIKYHPRDLTDDLDMAINDVISRGQDITSAYKNWYEIGAALANEFGEGGRERFHRLSQLYPKYKPAECDRQYTACMRNPKKYTRATIFYYINQI